MVKSLLILLVISFGSLLNAQNPLTGYGNSPEEQDFINSLPVYTMSAELLNRSLPSAVDNSILPYFYHKDNAVSFHQWESSCEQAASIGYSLTYELNRVRQLNGGELQNQLPTHFSYNFVSPVENTLAKSESYQAMTVVKDFGIPNRTAWVAACSAAGLKYSEEIDYSEPRCYNTFASHFHDIWLSGYDFYLQGRKNRAGGMAKFTDLGSDYGLNRLKQYLVHHGEDNSLTGGVAFFAMDISNALPEDIPEGVILVSVGSAQSSLHAMTIVGYNDDVWYDFNANGIDEQSEKGALKIVNSWNKNVNASIGSFFYFPYKLIREGKITGNQACCWQLQNANDQNPGLLFKVRMQHADRGTLRWYVGGSASYIPNLQTSKKIESLSFFSATDLSVKPMNGFSVVPFEIALDAGDVKVDGNNPVRYFYNLQQVRNAVGYENKIISLDLYDYRYDVLNPVISSCDVSNLTVNTGDNIMYIDYKLKSTNYVDVENIHGNVNFIGAYPVSIAENAIVGTSGKTVFFLGNNGSNSFKILGNQNGTNAGQLTINHLLELKGNGEFSSEGTMLINSDLSINNGAILRLNSGSITKIADNVKIVVKTGGSLAINNLSCLEFGIDAGIIVEAGATLSITGGRNNPLLTTLPSNSVWAGIYAEQGSIIDISYAKIEKALTAISGLPNNLVLKNSEISNCQRGISLAGCHNYEISNNLITGTTGNSDRYYGLSIVQSEGTITGNTISNFYNGMSLISCSPVVRKNNITDNLGYGIYKDGLNSYPDLSAAINSSNPLNNKITGNALSQIKLGSVRNINLQNGRNNIYHQDGIASPSVPCVAKTDIATSLRVLPAQYNYWGASTVNDNFFSPTQIHWIDYSNYATTPYLRGNNPASNEAETLLATADSLYLVREYSLSKATYLHLIEHFADSPSAYVGCTALLRPAFNCENNYADVEQLFYSLSSSDSWTDKDFFSEMQVSVNLFAGNYNSACQNAENMLEQADNQYETALALIDLSIAQAGTDDRSGHKSNSTDISNQIESLTGMLLSGNFNGLTADTKNLPANYRLYNSYPNPFNPTTTIKFDLPVSSQVKLAVYDVTGRQITILVNSILNRGAHSVEFNGANLASGVYFYQLEAAGKIIGRNKMMLLK